MYRRNATDQLSFTAVFSYIYSCSAVHYNVIAMFCVDYSSTRAVDCINAELCNVLGNLVQRVTSAKINPHQVAPQFDTAVFHARATDEDRRMLDDLHLLPGSSDLFVYS